MEKQNHWFDVLNKEHELILELIALLKQELVQLQNNPEKSLQIAKILQLLLDFGDKVHNVKEENHLFPLLKRLGIQQDDLIHTFIMEHEAERELLASSLQKFTADADSTAEQLPIVIKKLLEYCITRKIHIQKEQSALFPRAQSSIRSSENEKLRRDFQVIDKVSGAKEGLIFFRTQVEQLVARPAAEADLSQAILLNIFKCLPCEITFIDANDRICYFNKMDRPAIFPRQASDIGKNVYDCHQPTSRERVHGIITDFKAGATEAVDFIVTQQDRKILIRYAPVWDEQHHYAGCIEMVQDITPWSPPTP